MANPIRSPVVEQAPILPLPLDQVLQPLEVLDSGPVNAREPSIVEGHMGQMLRNWTSTKAWSIRLMDSIRDLRTALALAINALFDWLGYGYTVHIRKSYEFTVASAEYATIFSFEIELPRPCWLDITHEFNLVQNVANQTIDWWFSFERSDGAQFQQGFWTQTSDSLFPVVLGEEIVGGSKIIHTRHFGSVGLGRNDPERTWRREKWTCRLKARVDKAPIPVVGGYTKYVKGKIFLDVRKPVTERIDININE